MATYRVKVLLPETPKQEKFVEAKRYGFTLEARTCDAAAKAAKARLAANGVRVRGLSHSPGNVITVTAVEGVVKS